MKKQLLAMLLLLMLCLLPGFALAADGNTYTRLEELTDEKYSPRVSVFSLARSTEYTIAQAIADGKFPKADASRLHATIPDGMEATVSTEDGLITVTVDLANSDWKTILSNLSSYPYINFRHTLDRPDTDYEHHVGFGGNGVPDEPYDRVLQLMNEEIKWGEGDNIQAGNGESTCEIIAAQSLLNPGRDDVSTHIIAWLDHEDQKIYYEYYKVKVVIEKTPPFYIPFRYVTESMLNATTDADMPSGVTIKQIRDGDITFKMGSSIGSRDVSITLNAPDGATSMVIKQPEWRNKETYTVSGGKVSFTHQLHDPQRTQEEQYTITWYNGSKMVDYGLLMVHAEPENYAAWPYYETDWHAVPAERVERENKAANIGVTFTYNDTTGDLHIGYKTVASVTGEVGPCIARVKAPEGAAYYRTNHSGGNNIMGADTNAANQQVNFTGSKDLLPVPADGWIEIMNYEPVRVIQAGPVEVYIQMGEGDAWPYAGGVFSIFWYASEEEANTNNGKNPMRKEYVSDTMGALCVTNRVPVIESESDITEPVEEVTCVGKEAYEKGWRLVIRRYPYKGKEAFHYELTLENEYGAYQPLKQNMVFYMPYPKDYFSHPEYTFSLRHYAEDYSTFELVNVRETDYGVRFEISSLSPFVLGWGDGAGDSGDNTGSTPPDFQLHTFNMRPDFNVRMERVRAKSIMGCHRGTAVLKDTSVVGMNLGIWDTNPVGNKNGVYLDNSTIEQLIIEVDNNIYLSQLPTEPFVFLDNGSKIDEIHIFNKAHLEYVLKWVSCSNTAVDFIRIDGQEEPIKFAEFYDAYFGSGSQ